MIMSESTPAEIDLAHRQCRAHEGLVPEWRKINQKNSVA
jgi:hypothetical protein